MITTPTQEHKKYPHTWHLPWSPHNKRDDFKLKNTEHFYGKEVIITEKMDGENTTLYSDWIHARSIDSGDHPSRSFVKGLWGQIKHNIPEGMRICGENMYAVHSIEYDDLQSYFLVFNIWVGDVCLSWQDTLDYCQLLNLKTVPVLRTEEWSPVVEHNWRLRSEIWPHRFPNKEGYVVRVTSSFDVGNWNTSIAKYVRSNHVQSDDHWMHQEMKVNKLK